MPATLTAVLAAQRADTACRPTGQGPVPGDQVARLLDGACTELGATERERCLRLAIAAWARGRPSLPAELPKAVLW